MYTTLDEADERVNSHESRTRCAGDARALPQVGAAPGSRRTVVILPAFGAQGYQILEGAGTDLAAERL